MRKKSQIPPSEDRREYFRVNDAVRLSLRPVPEEDRGHLDERLEGNLVSGLTVMSSLAAISGEMVVNLRRIENSDPDVAAYLKALDRKIEVLGRAFIAGETELMEQPAHPVNLSAGGMGVLVDRCYDPGQVLEIKMLLFPSLTGVLMYGDVIDCEAVPPEASESGYGYRMRLAFTHMREQDRDILIRHVLRCQSSELRRKEEPE